MRNLFLSNPDMDLIEFYKSISDSPIQIFFAVLDIIIVLFFIYKILNISKGRRTFHVLKGIFLIYFLTVLSSIFRLYIINTILTSIMTYGMIGLIIVFQPEIRRGLEKLGAQNRLTKFFGLPTKYIGGLKENIYKVAIAAESLSEKNIGALIVFERDIQLKDIIETGIIIDAEVSVPLIQSIFSPNTALHDGAVIISENKIKSASSILPLSDSQNISKTLGTRHRAALGLSELTDAVVVIISEETGKISLAKEGELFIDFTGEELKKTLISSLLKSEKSKEKPITEKI